MPAPTELARTGGDSIAEDSPRLRMGQHSGRPIPVLLLARLGLDRSEQGHGIGAALLRDALTRCAAAADEIGGRAVVVHAKNATAAGFYRRFGFTPLPGNPHHLVLLVKDIRTSIRATSDAAG